MFIFLEIQLLFLKSGEHHTRRRQHKDRPKWWRDNRPGCVPICRRRASSAWRALGKPGLLRGEEDPVRRSHTALREPMRLDLGYARFLWRVSGFFTQILNPLFLMYPESFKNLGQVLKQTRAKLMFSNQQLHLF